MSSNQRRCRVFDAIASKQERKRQAIALRWRRSRLAGRFARTGNRDKQLCKHTVQEFATNKKMVKKLDYKYIYAVS